MEIMELIYGDYNGFAIKSGNLLNSENKYYHLFDTESRG